MKERNQWIKNFRQRMEDYEEPVPADLWGQLEQELPPSPRVIPWTQRWQAVAAVLVLLVVSTLTVWFGLPSADYVQQQSANWQPLPGNPLGGGIAMQEPAAEAIQSVETLEQPADAVVQVTALACALRTRETGMTEESSDLSSVAYFPEHQVAASEEKLLVDELVADTEADLQEDATQEEAAPAAMRTQKTVRPWYASARTGKQQFRLREKKSWTVGISTGNGALASSIHSDGYLPLPQGTPGKIVSNAYGVEALSEIDKLVQFKNMSEDSNVQSDISYKMPVVVGLSFRVDLSDDWALETGLTYTRLASETRSGTAKNHYGWEDKLHYVGIPVKLHRHLWNNRRFEVYTSVGGAVEKCVSGQRSLVGSVSTLLGGPDEKVSGGKEELEVDPLQLSLSAAAGAQFKLDEHWGVYVEPGIAYYFNDGSGLETIRKEHPFQFNLQLGLRFTLP